jgi:hypothetical protein
MDSVASSDSEIEILTLPVAPRRAVSTSSPANSSSNNIPPATESNGLSSASGSGSKSNGTAMKRKVSEIIEIGDSSEEEDEDELADIRRLPSPPAPSSKGKGKGKGNDTVSEARGAALARNSANHGPSVKLPELPKALKQTHDGAFRDGIGGAFRQDGSLQGSGNRSSRFVTESDDEDEEEEEAEASEEEEERVVASR